MDLKLIGPEVLITYGLVVDTIGYLKRFAYFSINGGLTSFALYLIEHELDKQRSCY